MILLFIELFCLKVIEVFKIHDGVELTTPLMLPLSNLYESNKSSVQLMTRSGNIVHIPYDLR